MSLLAFLGLIRQAFDSFMIEQTSDQILWLLGRFNEQWGKYTELGAVKRRFDGVQKDFDLLVGTRRRALEKPLLEIEALRREKGLPVDGTLFELGRRARQRARARRLTQAIGVESSGDGQAMSQRSDLC